MGVPIPEADHKKGSLMITLALDDSCCQSCLIGVSGVVAVTYRQPASSKGLVLEMCPGKAVALPKEKGKLVFSEGSYRALFLAFSPNVIRADPREALNLVDLYFRIPYLDPSKAWLKSKRGGDQDNPESVLPFRSLCGESGGTPSVAGIPECSAEAVNQSVVRRHPLVPAIFASKRRRKR